jgi:hypothetical protein
MSDPIELLFSAVRQEYGDASQPDLDSFKSILKTVFKNNPQLGVSLQRDERIVQYNSGDASAFQTAVNGGIAYIGCYFNDISLEELTNVVLNSLQSSHWYNHPSQTCKFPEISNFDLSNPIDLSRAHIADRQGLIGLSTCCSESYFYKSLCQRIKQLSRSKIQVREIISIKPQFGSLERAVESIKRYRSVLSHSDLICPVLIDIEDQNIVKDFWIEVQGLFADHWKHKLIVIIICRATYTFPLDIFSLPLPQFSRVHVDDWISDLVSALHNDQEISNGWQEVANDWIEKMHGHCQYEQHLDVGLVYSHLEFILSEVNDLRRQPSMSPHDFLARLYF